MNPPRTPPETTMTTNQNVRTKFDSTTRQSAEVSSALAGLDEPMATEVYERIQAVEADAVNAVTTKRAAQLVADETAAELAVLTRHLRLLNVACLNVCSIRGVVTAEYFAVIDRGDEAGLARRLEPEVRRVPSYGAPLADALAKLLIDLTAATLSSQNADDALITARRELDAAILNLQAVVAQGRAVLATLGVKVSRKKARKKAPVATVVPIAA